MVQQCAYAIGGLRRQVGQSNVATLDRPTDVERDDEKLPARAHEDSGATKLSNLNDRAANRRQGDLDPREGVAVVGESVTANCIMQVADNSVHRTGDPSGRFTRLREFTGQLSIDPEGPVSCDESEQRKRRDRQTSSEARTQRYGTTPRSTAIHALLPQASPAHNHTTQVHGTPSASLRSGQRAPAQIDFDEEGADEADDALGVGEDLHGIGPSLQRTVQVFDRIVRPDLGPVRGWVGGVGQQAVFGTGVLGGNVRGRWSRAGRPWPVAGLWSQAYPVLAACPETRRKLSAPLRPMCQRGLVDVIFERTGERRYAVEIRRLAAPTLRMEPAPGFDLWFPHDLQHLVVEEQLGLTQGIYGRLANGGTASTFEIAPVERPKNKRSAARERRKLKRRNTALAFEEANDFGRSERATYVAWQDWLAHSADSAHQAKAHAMREAAGAILARVGAEERLALRNALPRLRQRITEVTNLWSVADIGDSIEISWAPHNRNDRTE